jgi:hypothetical protein
LTGGGEAQVLKMKKPRRLKEPLRRRGFSFFYSERPSLGGAKHQVRMAGNT